MSVTGGEGAPGRGHAGSMLSRLDHYRRLLAPLAIVLAVMLAQASGVLVPLDRWLGDLRFHFGERAASGKVVIVDIDSRSLKEIGTWPWPRSLHAS